MSEWNGLPPNKEYRGWHWLYLYNGLPIPAYWDDYWLINGQHIKAADLNPEIKYWGQCLTPSEIEAKNARIAELEAALVSARLEGMEEAAKIAADYEAVAYQNGNLPINDPNECAAQTAREIAGLIRAAPADKE